MRHAKVRPLPRPFPPPCTPTAPNLGSHPATSILRNLAPLRRANAVLYAIEAELFVVLPEAELPPGLSSVTWRSWRMVRMRYWPHRPEGMPDLA